MGGLPGPAQYQPPGKGSREGANGYKHRRPSYDEGHHRARPCDPGGNGAAAIVSRWRPWRPWLCGEWSLVVLSGSGAASSYTCRCHASKAPACSLTATFLYEEPL